VFVNMEVAKIETKKEVICKACKYQDIPDNFDTCYTVYHDLRCPKCGEVQIDTSQINNNNYSYGDDNRLRMSNKPPKQEGK
jgi:predicted RNA-binding Zn-ribbon protein involved in translation (DUF1610 family)